MTESLTNEQKIGRSLQPGDWIDLRDGSCSIRYVIRNNPHTESIVIGCPDFLASSIRTLRYSELSDIVYVGRTKKRWWWNLLPFRDLCCPFSLIR